MMIAEDQFERKLSFLGSPVWTAQTAVELYTARLVKGRLGRRAMWRSLNLLGNLIDWIASIGSKLSNLGEVEDLLSQPCADQHAESGREVETATALSDSASRAVLTPCSVVM